MIAKRVSKLNKKTPYSRQHLMYNFPLVIKSKVKNNFKN